jgi:uncharacterized membrane-anchored protein
MQRILLATVVLLQAAVLIGMAVDQEILLRTSSSFLLEARVSDPRDMIKGHYIVLSYPAEEIPLSVFGDGHPARGEKVYVELGPSTNEFWTPIRAARVPIVPAAGHHLVKALVQYIEDEAWATGKRAKLSDPMVHLDLGLRRFYVNEEKGNPRGKLSVEVVARRGGKAYLKDLLVDGRSIREL